MLINKNDVELLTNLLEAFNVESAELIHDDEHKDVIKINFYTSKLPIYFVVSEIPRNNINEIVELFDEIYLRKTRNILQQYPLKMFSNGPVNEE